MSASEIVTALRQGDGVSTNPNADHEIRLRALGIEHDDLDAAIAALHRHGLYDDLLMTRLKKRKLHVKDELACAMSAV